MNEKNFETVVAHARSIKILESVLDLVTWDQETLMPPAGFKHRGEQQSLLAGLIHSKKNETTFIDTVHTLVANTTGDSDKDLIVKRLARDVDRAKKLPVSFVETFTQVTSGGFCAWSEAVSANNFSIFRPHLERIVDLVRQKAELLGYAHHPYDALLDIYEPETTAKDIDTLFTSLKPKLQSLLDEVTKTPYYKEKTTFIQTNLDQQLAVSKYLLTSIGYDWNASRIDTSDHPFSSGIHPTDSRITIRKQSNDLLDQIMSALHEAGHSFYEMGLSLEHYGTPLSEAASFGIHESQSRFWETVVGRSRTFTSHIFHALKTVLGTIPYRSEEELYMDLNRVQRSCIRTKADEVTYPLHVMLRYEIEKELVEGTLAVKDIPDRWNDGMENLLGIRPRNDREGCLQDVHWSFGDIGYFPTYTLGSWYATAFYNAMKEDLPSIQVLISSGQFRPILSWLHEHVWRHGRRYTGKQLVSMALRREVIDDDYIAYLRSKYTNP